MAMAREWGAVTGLVLVVRAAFAHVADAQQHLKPGTSLRAQTLYGAVA